MGYIPARAAAAKAVTANPEKSDRAIAKEIGTDHKTVAAARRVMNGDISPVEKRIGRDGKARRLPKHNNPMTEAELKHVPDAAHLVARIMPLMKALTKEGTYHATNISPDTVGRLARELLHEIFDSFSPKIKATVCGVVALEWEIDEPSKDYINDICKTTEAWIRLRDRVVAAAKGEEARKAEPAPREVAEVTTP